MRTLAFSRCRTHRAEEHDESIRPYTPSFLDDSSDCESIRQESIKSEQGKDDGASLKRFKTPESSVHRAPIASKAAWMAGVDTESIPESESPSSYANGYVDLDGNGHAVKDDIDSN